MNTKFGASGGHAVPTPRSLAVRPDASSLSPTDLENLINGWHLVGTKETDPELQRLALARMRSLIKQRDQQTIERMELERGLR